jgi:hypothetical protein
MLPDASIALDAGPGKVAVSRAFAHLLRRL